MKLENQVCSLELAKRLKELGVKQESLFYWWKCYWWDSNKKIIHQWYKLGDENYFRGLTSEDLEFEFSKDYSAFTVAELGEMLPLLIRTQRYKKYWLCWSVASPITQNADTEANARAKMVIYLKEQK